MNTTVVDGVLTVVNTLCNTLVPANRGTQKQCAPTNSPTFSPMKHAQLHVRSTYLKHLSELRDLHDAEILHQNEYHEEQWSDLLNLLCQLK